MAKINNYEVDGIEEQKQVPLDQEEIWHSRKYPSLEERAD